MNTTTTNKDFSALAKKILAGVIALVVGLALSTSAQAATPSEAYAASNTPAKVKTVKVSKKTTSTAKVTWSKAKKAKKYQVAYKKASAKKWSYKTVKANKKTLTIKKLSSNTKYKVKVRAINGKAKGKWSAAKSFTTKKKSAQSTNGTSSNGSGSTDNSKGNTATHEHVWKTVEATDQPVLHKDYSYNGDMPDYIPNKTWTDDDYKYVSIGYCIEAYNRYGDGADAVDFIDIFVLYDDVRYDDISCVDLLPSDPSHDRLVYYVPRPTTDENTCLNEARRLNMIVKNYAVPYYNEKHGTSIPALGNNGSYELYYSIELKTQCSICGATK